MMILNRSSIRFIRLLGHSDTCIDMHIRTPFHTACMYAGVCQRGNLTVAQSPIFYSPHMGSMRAINYDQSFRRHSGGIHDALIIITMPMDCGQISKKTQSPSGSDIATDIFHRYIYIYIVFHGQVPDSFTNKSPIFPGIDCLLSHHGSKIHDFGSTWFQNNTWSQTRQWNWFTLWKFDDLPSMSTPILHGKHLSSIPFSRCQWWYKPCEIPLIDD